MAKSNEETLVLLKQWRGEVRKLNRDLMSRVAENYRFAVGLQWDSEDVSALNDAGKPHLTYNEILPKLNTLFGEYLSNTFEPSVQPKRRGTATAGMVLAKMLKHIMDLCDGNFEEAAMMLDGITTGIGNVAIDIDDTKDLFNGDIVLRRISPFDVEWDWTSSDYNPDVSCRFVTERWEWTREQLKLQYPNMAAEIDSGQLGGKEDDIADMNEDSSIEHDEQISGLGIDKGAIQASQQLYTVRQTWWKEHERKTVLLDNEQQKVVTVNPAKMGIAQELLAVNPGRFSTKELVLPTLVKTVYCGDLVLENIRNPFGPNINRFPIRRFFPYYFDGYWLSPVDSMKDPQRETNKRISQTLHAINSIVRFFFLNKEQGGAKRKDIDAFLRQETQVVPYGTQPPELVVPNLMGVVASLTELGKVNIDQIGRVSGVTDPSQGRSEYSGQSGTAVNALITEFKQGSRHVFLNMARTRQQVYELMVEMVCNTEVFSIAEMRELVEGDELITRQVLKEIGKQLPPKPQVPPQPNPQALAFVDQVKPGSGAMVQMAFERAVEKFQQDSEQYEMQSQSMAGKYVFDQIRSLSFGRYGVKVSSRAASQTINLLSFYLMVEMRKMGMMVPDDILYKMADLPENIKDELIERSKQMQGAALAMQSQPQQPPQKQGAA
jgi:hypothetical protein